MSSRMQSRTLASLALLPLLGFGSLSLASSPTHSEAPPKKHAKETSHHGPSRIVLTRAQVKDVVLTEPYVCQIHARRQIQIRSQSHGYLEEIHVREGQTVAAGDPLFEIQPILYKAKYEAEMAEVRLAELEWKNAQRLRKQDIVSENEVALFHAKLGKAQAQAMEAKAELGFTSIRAPFAGIIDRLEMQLGSLIEEGEHLTSLSDNSVLWVYFNVPEARYLEYVSSKDQPNQSKHVELLLANGKKFEHFGEINAIEAKFNPETGNIPFRADFPNPEGLLRHGQTGTVLLHHTLHDALVIPQRATFEILDRRYVYVVDEDKVVHSREIQVQSELDDIFVVREGISPQDRFVLEGVRQVRDRDALEHPEFLEPSLALSNLKYPAE